MIDRSSLERYYDVRVLGPIAAAAGALWLAWTGLYRSIAFATLTGQYSESATTRLWFFALFGAAYFAARVVLSQNYHWRLERRTENLMAFSLAAPFVLAAHHDATHGYPFWWAGLLLVFGLAVLHHIGTEVQYFIRDCKERQTAT